VTNDDVISTGQKLQRSMDLRITIRRSDALRVEMNGDRYRRNILYDGKVLTVSDPEQKFYATFDSPPTIDATIAAVREKLGLDLPLGVLFADNAYEALSKNARVATYVGLHRLSGEMCHQLAFSQNKVDWQIWISAKGPPLPRKLVIDFKDRPERPQYTATLVGWNLEPQVSAAEFKFSPPADFQKIEFLRTEGGSK